MRSNQDYDARRKAQAIHAFRNHTIHDRGENRWLISVHYGDGAFKSFYWAEIVALSHGVLFVHGDIEACIFSGGSYREPMSLLHWVGAHDDVSYYLAQKARMGMGTRSGLDAFDPDVALYDIEQYKLSRLEEIAEDCFFEDGEAVPELNDAYEYEYVKDVTQMGDKGQYIYPSPRTGTTDDIVEVWKEAPRHVDDGPYVFHHWLYDELVSAGDVDCGEYVESVGTVVDSRVYYAWAAVRRLLELLKEEEADANVDG
jgi:hypothetical protein